MSFHPPRFVLGVIAAVSGEDFGSDYPSRTSKLMREVMTLLFAPLRLKERSPEHQKTRRQLFKRVQCSKLRHECERIKIPLVMDTSFWNSDLYERFQTEVDAIFSAQSRCELTETRESAQCVFVLEGLTVDFDFTGNPRNADRLGAQLARRQVPLQVIRIGEVDNGGSIARGALTGPSSNLKITLRGLFNHESDRVAVCSKIAAMPAVTSAELHLMTKQLVGIDLQTSRERTLQWLAFAYFSPFSMNWITKVDLTFNGLSARDAAAIVGVVNSNNPLQLLVNSSESDCQIARLVEEVEIFEVTTNNFIVLLPGTNVWIVHNRPDEPTLEVLVAEFGVRTIERSKLSVESNITPSSSVSELVITLVEADYEGGDENGDYESLIPLLEAVGANMTTLAV